MSVIPAVPFNNAIYIVYNVEENKKLAYFYSNFPIYETFSCFNGSRN